jgi:hypothetical protein
VETCKAAGVRSFWFHLSMAVGSLPGLLLLVNSGLIEVCKVCCWHGAHIADPSISEV